jgi:hypothetical protein
MILIGTDEGIFRWFEGGGWPVFHCLQDRSVVVLESPGPGVLVAVDRSGDVLESVNNGLDWQVVPLPAGSGRPSALAVQGNPPAIVLAVKPMGAYRRVVGTPIPRPAEPVGPLGGSPRQVLVSRARRLAGNATAMLAPQASARARARIADAETVRLAGWSPLNTPPAPRTAVGPEVRTLAASPESGGPWLAAVTGAGLWRSTDQGRALEQCAGLPSELYAVRQVPGQPGAFWAATGDGLWFSSDGGQTWQDRSGGLEKARQVRAVAVKPDAPEVLLAGAAPVPAAGVGGAAPTTGLGYALYESTNGGKSWAPVVKRNFPEGLEYDTISDIRFDPASPDNILVALGSGELWVTRNGGAYWGPLARQIRAARVLCAVR